MSRVFRAMGEVFQIGEEKSAELISKKIRKGCPQLKFNDSSSPVTGTMVWQLRVGRSAARQGAIWS